MSIESIRALSMNPHFMARLIQAFLCGYGDACNVQKIFLAMPILYHEPARQKLFTAKSSSRIESLYSGKKPLVGGESISERVRMAGFEERYKILLPYVKHAIIVGCNEKVISLNSDNQLRYVSKLDYKDRSLKQSISQWIRAAYYLGMTFKKATPEQLSHILEVELS